jgi:beta-carotene 3-hydroxylase
VSAVGLGLIALGCFAAMELVSYATHRWVMHGVGMRWHLSHHRPATGRFEANDVFPLAFSLIGFGLFLTAALTRTAALYAAAGGVTAYGVAYLFLHEISIHHRLPIRVRDHRYLRWVRDAHRVHHTLGGEPYGMLLPILSRHRRGEAARRDRDDRKVGLDRSLYDAPSDAERHSARSAQ